MPNKTQLPLSLIEKLPKTDLHVHLDGSLRLRTILELADKFRIELPAHDEDGLRQAMNLGRNCGSLVEYLKAFDVTLRVMQNAEGLTRIAYELAEDAAKENVRYMEVRYSPMLHTQSGLALTTVVEAVPGGWWYSLGLPNRQLAVAFMTDADLLGETLRRPWQFASLPLADAPTTAARLRATDCSLPWPPPRIRPAHVGRLASVAGPDWLAVGEAAVCFDPLSSYGIEAALGTGFYAGAAISEHLGGRRDALSGYAELIDHTFAQYLLACHDRYSIERRWPSSPFWRRRHRLGTVD